jgi:hypothetical protein
MQDHAEKAASLIEHLTTLESTWEGIAAFWKMCYDMFQSEGQKMIANEENYSADFLKLAAKNDLSFWQDAKVAFETYASKMPALIGVLNFDTDAEPPPTQAVVFSSLGISIRK